MSSNDPLQKARQAYLPVIPHLLRDLLSVALTRGKETSPEHPRIKDLFPLTFGKPPLKGEKGGKRDPKPQRVGVVFSGGPAPGGHNVIAGLFDALKKLNPKSQLFGFLDGPSGIVSGKSRELTAEGIASYRNQGGFDLIGSGRTKIETEEQLQSTCDAMFKMQLTGLVVIGGDDSNTNAAILAETFVKKGVLTQVIGVPKTIDGDLKNRYVESSFGFDTASKSYSEIIGNIARDAASSKKYYHFIKLMGRSASHITLECALATQPNAALIGEEIAAQKKTLHQITEEIADLICKRLNLGKEFGVVLIPEGLIEFIPEISVLIKELNALIAKLPSIVPKEVPSQLSPDSKRCFETLPEKIQEQLLINRDPHGNVRVSQIETERLLIDTVERELHARQKKGTYQGKFFAQGHFLGYEGRCGYPSNFDANYCYALGHAAALLIDEGATGTMAYVSELTQPPETWGVGGVPLTSLMTIEVRKGKEKPVIEKALVDLRAKPFAYFCEKRKHWELEDCYSYPGPIQFFGGAELTDRVPLTIGKSHV